MIQHKARFKVGDIIEGTWAVSNTVVTGEVVSVVEYQSLKPDYSIVLKNGDIAWLDEERSGDIRLVEERSGDGRRYRVRFSFNSQTHGYYYSEWFETLEEAKNFEMFVNQSKGVNFQEIEVSE